MCLGSAGCFKLNAPEPAGSGAAESKSGGETESDITVGSAAGVFFSRADGWRQIFPSGGQPPYAFELMEGPGIITKSGFYVGDGTEGVAVVRVEDSAGDKFNLPVVAGRFFSPLMSETDAAVAAPGLQVPLIAQASSSGSFRVPSTGLIARPPLGGFRFQGRGALIEGPRENYILQSEQFAGVWEVGGGFAPFVEANAAVAPDGRTTASRLVEDPDAFPPGSHVFSPPPIGLPGGGGSPFVYSCFFKAAEFRNVAIEILSGGDFPPDLRAHFNVRDGAILSVGAGVADLNADAIPEAGVIPYPGGWYRVWIGMVSISGSPTVSASIGLLDDSGAGSFSGGGDRGIFAWGCQIEAGVTLGSYIPSYNLVNGSQDLLGGGWVLSGDMGAPDPDVAFAPDGTPTADKIREAAGLGPADISTTFPVRDGATYVASCFVKAAERDEVALQLSGDFGGLAEAYFDLATSPGVSIQSGDFGTKEALADGWFRLAVANVATAGGSGTFTIQSLDSGSPIYTMAAGSGLLVWGCQVEEAGAPLAPRAYSSTQDSAAFTLTARKADLLEYDNSSEEHVSSAEGTVILAYTPSPGSAVVTESRILFDCRAGASDGVELFVPAASGTYRAQLSNGGIIGINSTSTATPGHTEVIAVSWNDAVLALYVNGVEEANFFLGSPAVGPVGALRIGSSNFNSFHAQGEISHVMTFGTALPASDISRLTTVIRKAMHL